eukprot:NODE_1984_length_681_cov_45.467509_g1934_i0.p1 GENE.NODE_1984_length_681_cov_45.467509_g1934_i0~~NODE_1984_length_681_cov_45.467509_g1934_i0.p1  ORF type:complete len:196 (+),score=40.49 NODE_1984_length_681_cov_45.467509_g1934_i0:64-651(+)
MKYIVEHLEPELGKWCLLEYARMAKVLGPGKLMITNLKPDEISTIKAVAPDAECLEKQVDQLGLNHQRICLLDPKAEKMLEPSDISAFDYMLFGGILGDDPPQHRTKELYKIGAQTRLLGDRQMSTDTAVVVTYKILDEKMPFEKIKFIDDPDVSLRDKESVHLPYRYLCDADNNPIVADGLIEYLIESADEPLN